MENSLKQFERIVTDLLRDEKRNSVAEFVPANELFQQLDLSLGKTGISNDQLEKTLTDLVLKTPRTATNGFFNQLFGGRNEKAVLGDLLAVILNNSMYTYKAAGPQIGVEKVIIREVCNLIGWDLSSEGTFASGGSMTNYMAMVMARDSSNKDIRNHGLNKKLTVYTSKESHYSIPKNAAFCGIGRDQVRYVPTDQYGKMDPEQLEKLIADDVKHGFSPIMVNLTAGTTVMGAFDPIRKVRTICDNYGMWLHVDGAYCGSVLFSAKYKHLIEGIELVDSFSFNAHKMIGTPLTCSIIVSKNKQNLYDSFSNDASYLYQTDHDDFNLGKTSLQCGRRNDALKFWTLWKSVGTNGLSEIVNHQFHLADIAREYLENNPNYTLYSYDESISICFNYKDISAKEICTVLYEHSELLVSYGEFNDVEFIRLVTINAQNKEEDILNFFQTLENFITENAQLFKSKVTSL